MAWNTGKSILGTGDKSSDVEREADIIFTAVFIGMTLFQEKKRNGSMWRVDMEPNTELNKNRLERTEDDRTSMKMLNDGFCCINFFQARLGYPHWLLGGQ